jgi:hypothetical protein
LTHPADPPLEMVPTPPEGLLHDEARRTFPALVVPFGQIADPSHEDRLQPRKKGGLNSVRP